MPKVALHRFEVEGRHYAVDPESCFCFECDAISRDVLEHYPQTPINHILTLLDGKHDRKELEEVIGELEWLRSAKSILQPPKLADLEKMYAPSGGLRRVTVVWNGADAPERASEAFELLLGRSGTERELSVELVCGERIERIAEIETLAAHWQGAAQTAGKTFSLSLRVSPQGWRKLPAALEGHDLEVVVQLTDGKGAIAAFNAAVDHGSLAAIAKWMQSLAPEQESRIVLRPRHARFGDAAKALREAGFKHIELDSDALFLNDPAQNPAAVFDAMKANATYYAAALLKRDLFRVDPIAGLFLRIYQGTPQRRSDPAGTHELAIDTTGEVFASRAFLERKTLSMGNARKGGLDANLLADFENAGSVTTAGCTTCWARSLCGGGSLAVHQALSGSFREPSAAWCEAQRGWIEAAVASFNALSSEGVNFVQVYESLGRRPKISLWQAAKTLLNAPLSLRPLADSDAPLLSKWENWNEAAYFLCHEAGTMTTCPYDREMDAVHPHAFEQEFLITESSGKPKGLLRLRPMLLPGVATVWLYLRDEKDYQAASVRRGFKNLLGLLPRQESLTQLMVPIGPRDGGLGLFLQSADFKPTGVQRQGLYLHGAYHDVTWYTLTLGKPTQTK